MENTIIPINKELDVDIEYFTLSNKELLQQINSTNQEDEILISMKAKNYDLFCNIIEKNIKYRENDNKRKDKNHEKCNVKNKYEFKILNI